MLAFVRLVTKAGLFLRPLTFDEALDRVRAWLAAAPAVVVDPTHDHPAVLRRLLQDIGVGATS